MSKPLTVKAHSLKIHKVLGEKAIRLVANQELLNRDLKIRTVDEYIYIPLVQKPSDDHLSDFNDELHRYDIIFQSFYRRTNLFRNVLEAMGDILPPQLLAKLPRAIDFVGDIAVVEVPPELQEHRELVGKAILKAHKRVRTVLAKASVVQGIRRLREYEVIYGSSDTETVQKEYGCKYHLDLRKVYYSPRLSHEHKRVASNVEEGETIIDMFTGVGPFSVLIARTLRDVKVYAIDLNPDAVRYLERNIIVNGVLGKVIPILGDAKEVVYNRLRGAADRVIMNLPKTAIEYLEAASDALKPEGGVIHYYEFAEGPEPVKRVKRGLVETLNKMGQICGTFIFERIVREVAPFKWQVVVDIRIFKV